MTAHSSVEEIRASSASLAPCPARAVPSFAFVYHEYFDFIWVSARRLGAPMDAIDDVVQDIFLVVHARLETLERSESLRSWLYSVVRKTVSVHHRRRHARDARESWQPSFDDCPSPLQCSPLDLAVRRDEVRVLWALLEELDPVKREVLILAEIAEMTMPEIAEVTRMPLNTAYSRLRAARQEFNKIFARYAARQRDR